MKKLTVLLMSALVLGAVQAAYAAEQQDYASTIQVFKSDPVVAKFFSDSYGYAVFPTIAKAGFVVGGSYGEGQVYQGGKVTGTAKLIEGSIGWQFGGQAFSEIIFFQDKRAYDEFTSGISSLSGLPGRSAETHWTSFPAYPPSAQMSWIRRKLSRIRSSSILAPSRS
jgi:lipid-binding SYLF domain-containing protein